MVDDGRRSTGRVQHFQSTKKGRESKKLSANVPIWKREPYQDYRILLVKEILPKASALRRDDAASRTTIERPQAVG